MTDPTPNGQTWVCGWTDVGANCLAGDPCDPETCGYRPVPPAPSSDERAPFADLTDEEFAVFAEGAGFDPAPRSDTPSDERPQINCSKTAFRTENHDPHEHQYDRDTVAWCRGLDMPALRPSTPAPEASGRAAPTPFETFQAGMAAGLLSTRHALIHDYTEDEVRQEFRDWLDERAADRGEPTP